MVGYVVDVRVGGQVLGGAHQGAGLVHNQVVVYVSDLQDRSPFVSIGQLSYLKWRVVRFRFYDALRVNPVEVFFGVRANVVPPLVEVTCLCVGEVRLLGDFGLYTIARPFRVPGAFSRYNLRVLCRLRRAFFYNYQGVFLRVRLACHFARCSVCDACDALPAELIDLFTK